MAESISKSKGKFDLSTTAMNGYHKALGLVAGVTGMGYLITQSLEATAEMQKNATMAGVSTKAYQELSFAASKFQVMHKHSAPFLPETA